MACCYWPSKFLTDIWRVLLSALIQSIQALEHPKFKEMIDIASCAKDGVKIPGRKATRAKIKRIFKNHLKDLKERLNVSSCPLPLWICSNLSIIECHCSWRSQHDVQWMAGFKYRWLLCRHRTLGWRDHPDEMGAQKRPPWVHPPQ